MRRRAQSSIEYVFMFILALVVIYLVVKTFIDPRTGTVKKTGGTINRTINDTISTLNSMISEP